MWQQTWLRQDALNRLCGLLASKGTGCLVTYASDGEVSINYFDVMHIVITRDVMKGVRVYKRSIGETMLHTITIKMNVLKNKHVIFVFVKKTCKNKLCIRIMNFLVNVKMPNICLFYIIFCTLDIGLFFI